MQADVECGKIKEKLATFQQVSVKMFGRSRERQQPRLLGRTAYLSRHMFDVDEEAKIINKTKHFRENYFYTFYLRKNKDFFLFWRILSAQGSPLTVSFSSAVDTFSVFTKFSPNSDRCLSSRTVRGSVEFINRIIDETRRGRENIKGKIADSIESGANKAKLLIAKSFQESRSV